ncbi:hypothetical protein BVY04_00365 [bacterium M21]|nr:hypothetical protein BVY04_00365 [bacterium M21]
MSYQVLARKWRPQRFADVLGQSHITQTLQNAIQTGRIGHAYLFVGSRGIGKTTSARIFAKALNCSAPEKDEAGRIEPCCKCPTCLEIAACNCLDVMEVDGASHNKVEDIRDLCENVQYAPTNGRSYKVYIIDEVHMLTVQAWNALLKTLEEPPEHVKFLFATTEAHKVLPTILSRTQRFDLKRIPASVIVQRLRQIADKEGVHITNEALDLIARAAEGGMRDAQSIFDQMIAFCGGMSAEATISEADVIDVFGMTSKGELQRLQVAMLQNNPGELIHAIHNLADKGRDLEKLYGDLLQGLRDTMVFQVVNDPERILEITASEAEDLSKVATMGSPHLVQRLVEGLLSSGDQIRHTLNKRVFLEVTLLKVMQDGHAIQVDDLITALRKMKETGTIPDLPSIQPGAASAPSAVPAPPPAQPMAPKEVAPAPQPQVQQQAAPQPAPVAAPQPVPVVETAPIPAPPEREEPIIPCQSEAPTIPAPARTPSPPVPPAQAPVQQPAPQAPVPPQASQEQPAPAPSAPMNESHEDGRQLAKGAEVIEQVRQDDFVKKVCSVFEGNVIDARG